MRRYTKDKRIRGGKLETAKSVSALRRAKEYGLIPIKEIVLTESQRLDHIAHEYLGNSRDWWIIAALSDIGWGLQLPPGTILYVPTDISAIRAIVG
tara:strand:+ start:49 stop:336 length:288 start_codon:yes stop_codon:yes gene_type:complete